MTEEKLNLLPDFKRWQRAYRNLTFLVVGVITVCQIALYYFRLRAGVFTDAEQKLLLRQVVNTSIFDAAVLIVESLILFMGKSKDSLKNSVPIFAMLLILFVNASFTYKSNTLDAFLAMPVVMTVIYTDKKLARIVFIISEILIFLTSGAHFIVRGNLKHYEMLLDGVLGGLLVLVAFIIVRIVIKLVQEQNKKVLRANQQAVAAEEKAAIADNAKMAFLANISHEIRTPMNAIVGMTELLLRKKKGENTDDYAKSIKASGESLLSIINDILDFSKMQSGTIELSEKEYAPAELVEELSYMFWNRIGRKDVEILFDIDDNIPETLLGDVGRIKQVISNLMTNAIKYTDTGFVKLTMKQELSDAGNIQMLVAVEDTGRGMKQTDLERAFASFEQIHTKRNRKQEGTGMGLSISREIVQLMGGELKARSEEGKGSTFYFSIVQQVVSDKPMFTYDLPSDIVIGGHAKHTAVTLEMITAAKRLGVGWRDAEPDQETQFYFTDDAEYLTSVDARAEIDIDDVKFVYIYNPSEEIPEGLPEEVLTIKKPLYTRNIAGVLLGEMGQREESEERKTLGVIDFVAPEANILLVDDNEMNLIVAEALLKPTKMKIDRAENGKQAVEKVKAKKYDFVFMDHMMPIMDGVEATKTIRQIAGSYYQNLPIIAFTANVLSESKKEFMEAGMNDFVTKPVELKALCEMLKKYMDPSLIREATEADFEEEEKPSDEAGQTLSIEHLDGIDTQVGIEACGSEELFRKLLGDYCRLIDLKSTKLEKCLADGMIRDYTIEVHALKNTSRMIGATELSGWFKQMEEYGNAGDVAAIEAENEDLLLLYKSYKRVLEPFMDAGDANKQEADVDELINDLQNMDHAMDTFDLDTVAVLMKKIQGMRVPECVKEKERLLEAYVADVAMEEVMQTTKEMVELLKNQ